MKIDHLAPDLLQKIQEAPTKPGVYLMKNAASKIIYVGKAKILKNRVQSYFQDRADLGAKTQALVSHIEDIEFKITENEKEALLLEAQLIKRWKPRYNIRLKDDKSYPYLQLDLKHPFPRFYYSRRPRESSESQFWGPYPNSLILKSLLQIATKIHKIRDCSDREFSNRSRPCLSYQMNYCTAPCVGKVTEKAYAKQIKSFKEVLELGESLESTILKWTEKMNASAENQDFEQAAIFRDQIKNLESMREHDLSTKIKFTDQRARDLWFLYPQNSKEEAPGKHLQLALISFRKGVLTKKNSFFLNREEENVLPSDLEAFLQKLILEYYLRNKDLAEEVIFSHGIKSKEIQFLFENLESLSQEKTKFIFIDERNDFIKLAQFAEQYCRLEFVENMRKLQSKENLMNEIKDFCRLPSLPFRVECLDVSNFQGDANVASCVVFVNGEKASDEYRHFKIKGFSGQNDFASMKEVIERRYVKSAQRPDLLVIDGGKGQLSSVMSVFKEHELKIPVIALAKSRTESDFKSSELKKSEERVFLAGEKLSRPLKSLDLLKFFTEIRNEAHRFAINFHRKQRSKKLFKKK